MAGKFGREVIDCEAALNNRGTTRCNSGGSTFCDTDGAAVFEETHMCLTTLQPCFVHLDDGLEVRFVSCICHRRTKIKRTGQNGSGISFGFFRLFF
jgi:hypothetical protein